MARIPDQIPLAPLEGETTPAIAPAPTDFGLGQAGQTLESVAMGQRRNAMLSARVQGAQARQAALTSPQWQQFGEADARGFAADAGAWNGQPGFSTDQIGKVQGRLDDATKAFAASGATPAQVSEFRSAGLGVVAQRGAQANQFEQQQLMQQADQVREATTNGYVANGIAAQAGPVQKLYDGYDGSTPTLVPQVGAAVSAAWAPIIASAPASLQPRLQLEASVQQQQEIARAAAHQGEAQTAFIGTQGNNNASALLNTVVSNPLAYDTVTAQLPKIAATLPADVAAKELPAWRQSAVQARITGLIGQRHPDQALAELNDGRYDHILEPQQKAELVARSMAEDRANGPDAIGAATAAASVQERMQADIEARARTGHGILSPGELDADRAAGFITAADQGKYNFVAQRADQEFAAVGPVAGMSNAQLATAASAPPPPPDDVPGTQAFQARQKAVAAELQARKDPGTWAFSNTTQQLGGQPLGPALAAKWQAATQPGATPGAMADYAGNMLGVQRQAGIAPSAFQIVPQATAAQIAASVTTAPPEGKLAALQGVGRLLNSLPPTANAPDGSIDNPRAILARQLAKAGLSPIESSAIADFGDDPSGAKLGRVAAALNDTTLKTPLKRGDPIVANVRNDLAPFLASAQADADGPQLAQARIDRTVLVARYLEGAQHMSPTDAAMTASRDLAGGYRYSDGWRMPVAAANAQTPFVTAPGRAPGGLSGINAARRGMGQILAALGGNGGAGFYAPSTIAGPPDQQRRIFASQVARSGAWKTLPDDSGVALGVPGPDGTWRQVHDRWGRPVQASWGQLEGVANGQPSPFAAPPPNTMKDPAGAPVPAFSKSTGFGALSWAIEQVESGGVNGRVSPAGALGVMQIMPDAPNGKLGTGHIYANRLGLPWDPERARTDPAYNRQIANAALGDLTGRYMTGANPSAGLGLAAVAYNAGEGRLTGYTDAKGYHPGWLQTIGDPRTGKISLNDFLERIPAHPPYNQPGKYGLQVLGLALGRLKGG